MKRNVIYPVLICLTLLANGSLAQVSDADHPDSSWSDVRMFLREHLPELEQEMVSLREEEPGEFLESLEEHMDFVDYLRELKEENRMVFDAVIKAEKLEYQGWAIADQILDEEDPDRQAELRSSLQEMLEQVFDARMLEREAEIKAMTDELDEIKSIMEQRRDRKAQIIRRQLESMLDEVDETMEWW